MLDDLVNKLKDYEGTTIHTEIGEWRLRIEEEGEFNWHLEELSEVGAKLFQYKEFPVHASTRFVMDTSVAYSLYLGSAPNPVSMTRVEFTAKNEDAEHSIVGYLELVDQLLQLSDSNIQQWHNQWRNLRELSGGKKDEQPEFASEEPANEEPAKATLSQVIAGGDENAIIAAASGHPRWKADEILDLYSKAKELRSNKLMNLAKAATAQQESMTIQESIVNLLLQR